MNRDDFYRILPRPEEISAGEYSAIHDFLVDAINDYISSEDEDIEPFVIAVLEEVSEWATHLIALIKTGNTSVAT